MFGRMFVAILLLALLAAAVPELFPYIRGKASATVVRPHFGTLYFSTEDEDSGLWRPEIARHTEQQASSCAR